MNDIFSNSFIPSWESLNKGYLNQKYAVYVTWGGKISLDNFVPDKMLSTRSLTLVKKTTRSKTSKFKKKDKITVFLCRKESFQQEAIAVLRLISVLNTVTDSVGELVSNALPTKISKDEEWKTLFHFLEDLTPI